MIVSQNLCFEVRETCCKKTIALYWASSQTPDIRTNENLGWWSWWVFECYHIREIETNADAEVDIYGIDLATQQGWSAFLRKSANVRLTMIADMLTEQQARGLETLLTSSRVYMWVGTDPNFVTPQDFIEVKVETGKFTTLNGKDTRQQMTIQITYGIQTVAR